MMKRELYAKNYGQNCSSNEEGGWQLQSIEAFIALGKAVADLMETDIEIVEGEIAIRVCIQRSKSSLLTFSKICNTLALTKRGRTSFKFSFEFVRLTTLVFFILSWQTTIYKE